jgi:tetratricopeptide (TPR) repeat protein
MLSRYFCLLAALLVGFAAAPVGAQAQVTASLGAPQAGGIEGRRQDLLRAMLAAPANLDIAFEYAALSVKAGDLEGAVSTLERMLIFAPGLPRLQLELGVLYHRLGANEVARGYFEAVLAQPDVPAEVRSKVEAYLEAIERGGATSGFHGAIMVGARYQTNANSAPFSNIVNLNGVDFTLGPGGTNAPDGNGFVSGNFRYVHDLGTQGDRLIATLQTYGALYATQRQLDTGAAELTFGPEFTLQHIGIDNASLGIYGIGTGVMLGGDPHLIGLGLGTNVKALLAPQLRANATLEYRRELFRNSPARPNADLRSGHRVTGRAGLEYAATDDITLFGILTGERRLAQAGFLSLWEIGVTAGVVFDFASPLPQLDKDWSLTLSAGYFHRRFDAPDPVINANVAEVDSGLQLAAALSMPLDDGWSVQTSASWRGVASNYDLARTSNVSVTAGVMKEF